MKDLDQQMIFWAIESRLPVLVLLTKADKMKSGARKAQLLKVRESSKSFGGDVQIELFSSLKGIGLDQVRRKLDTWFGPELERQLMLAAAENGETYTGETLSDNSDD
jgi:GTP-binding protein